MSSAGHGLSGNGRAGAHALLLGLALYAVVHDSATIYPNQPDPAWAGGWLAPALSLASLLLWLAVAPVEERRAGLLPLARLPIVTAGAAGFLVLYGFGYSLAIQAPLSLWIQAVVACFTTFVLAAALSAAGFPMKPLMAGVSLAGVGICIEGLAHLFANLNTPQQLIAVTGNRYGSGDPYLANRLGNGSLPYPTLLVSLFLVFASLALGLLAVARSRQQRLFALGAYLLNAVCAWLTASRGGIVLLVLVTLAHVGLAALRNARGLALTSAAGLVLFAGFVARLVLTKGSVLRADGSLSSRVKMWRVCWHVFKANPLTGGGPGAFREAWRGFIRSTGYPEYSVPHSLPFGILCEGGLVLFAACAALLCGLAIETRRALRSPIDHTDKCLISALALGLAAVLAHDLTENSFQMHAMYMLTALFAGVVMGARHLAASSHATQHVT